MCGFVATTDAGTFHSAQQIRALDLLRTRGPDALGSSNASADGPAFGHTRLAIIGLGEAGAQPYGHVDSGILVFNGEIYNYEELARSLGIKPDSDTHVLHEIMRRGRLDLLKRIRGMYSFVHYESRTGTWSAARDPFGVKPLYVLQHRNNELTFASTAAALAGHPDANDLNAEALVHFLAAGFFPAGTSPYASVSKLRPGIIHRWTRSAGGWDMATTTIPLAGWDKMSIPEALADSVQAHLVADVEVGVLMSGGVDSTLIAALANAQSPALRTYALVNPHSPQIDEGPLARWNARLLGTSHTEVEATPSLLAAQFQPLIASAGEPFADPAYLALSLLSNRVAQDVKVALAGEGADELFGGYRRYDIERFAQRPSIGRLARFASRRVDAVYGSNRRPATMVNRSVHSLAQTTPYRQHLALMTDSWALVTRMFPEAAQGAMELGVRTWMDSTTDDWGMSFPPNRAFDMRQWLPNVFLEKSDRASMLNSLEVRVPFLDPVVASAAAGWEPPDSTKKPLRDELHRLLPDVRLPPRKKGLAVDTAAVLDSGLNKFADAALFEPSSALAEIGLDASMNLDALSKRADLPIFRLASVGAWHESRSDAM